MRSGDKAEQKTLDPEAVPGHVGASKKARERVHNVTLCAFAEQ